MDKTSEIVKSLYKKNNWNDELLNKLLDILPNMKSDDRVSVEFKYSDVTGVIKLLIQENINVDLCVESIKLGLEQRKSEREGRLNG